MDLGLHTVRIRCRSEALKAAKGFLWNFGFARSAIVHYTSEEGAVEKTSRGYICGDESQELAAGGNPCRVNPMGATSLK